MNTFTFEVTQDLKGYYKGELVIEATSERDAISKIKGMSNSEIEENCTDWEMGDEMDPCGTIIVYNKGKVIK